MQGKTPQYYSTKEISQQIQRAVPQHPKLKSFLFYIDTYPWPEGDNEVLRRIFETVHTRGQEEHSECRAREGVVEREDCNTVIRAIVFDVWDSTSRRPHMSMRFAVDARLFRREIRLLLGGLSSE